jgi:biotin carboxyl carrier protein
MTTQPFQLLVNGQYSIEAMPEDAHQIDVVQEQADVLHVLKGGQAYRAEFVSANDATKTYTFKIAGNNYEVKIEDHYDRLVKHLGLTAHSHVKMNTVKAPMPGMVLGIMVTEGQDVQKGDPLLILEAMKMENVLKAVGEGRVKAIKVQKGTAVDKNQLLIEME